MSALFPDPPIKTVPLTPFINAGTLVYGFYGPVFYNGARWGIGWIFHPPDANQPPSVIKSTDGGATWAKIDQAHTPTALNAVSLELESYFTSDGIWHVLMPQSNGSFMAYAEFDTNVGTWGTAILSGTIRAQGGFFKMAQRLNGEVLVVYDNLQPGPNNTLSYSLISGGVWGAKIDIATVPVAPSPGGNNPVGILVDSSDRAHILYERFLSGVSNELWHVALDASNTPSTPVLVGAVSLFGSVPTPIGVGQIWDGKLLWAGNFSPENQVVLYEGTPLSAPVFTTKVVANVAPQSVDMTLHAPIIIGPDGKPWIFWCNNPVADSDTIRETVYATYDGTTFSAPILAWDSIGNAAVGDPIIGAQIASFSISVLDDGSGPHVEMLSTEFIDADYNQTLVFFAAPPPALSILCDSPPAGTVGVFYSHTFPASGGVPPYTFSIIGTLPPGLTLNTSTGVVSGIPTTAGPWNFTVKVTGL